MAKVSSLTIKKQSGTSNTHFATWVFNENTKNTTVSSGAIKKGDLVSIKAGATYYNGVAIPSWVMSQKWYVLEVYGNRAVINRNQSGTNSIMSPIHVGNLIGGSGGSSSTTIINTLDHYEVKWTYDTGDGVWFDGGSSDVKVKNATYNAPEGSIKIKATVKPVSKKHKVNGKDTSYWSGTSVSATYSVSVDPPETPSTPSVSIEKYKLTATLDNIPDARTDQIQFEVYKGTKRISSGTVTVVTRRAVYALTVSAGGEYRVRCRSINLYGNSKNYGGWSDYSSIVKTIPTTPSSITTCKATSSTSIYLAWTSVSNATSYDIEYTTNKRYFDGSDQTSTITGIEYAKYEKTGLESGKAYFFRVRAVNGQGTSGWSGIKSVTIGKKPTAPTTWSSTTTAITGEPLNLYWVHNCEDNSSMTYAEVELTIDGRKETYTVKGTTDESDKDKTKTYRINTSSYKEGTKIHWRVRTAGVTKEYGAWSILRTADVFAPPTLELTLTDSAGTQIRTIESFPLIISANANPKTQVPIGYHLTIVSNATYSTTDYIGNPKIVTIGEEVYSSYFDTERPLNVSISASDIDLENNVSYKVICIVSMNSGLTAQAKLDFKVSWTEIGYEPDAEISYDDSIYASCIRPYCIDEEGLLIEGILLSVYRREFDGSFTELTTNINNLSNTVITDPHPSLDYARYRIVAITEATGAIAYYDAPGCPINEKAAIIQWDEEWSNFDTTSEAIMETPPWAGSLLRLPYNIDVSDNNDQDVSLIKYIGRKHPVSYYGTQIGSTSTWNTDIPSTDVDTLYAVRRLSVWMGNAYVREPSGSGYWASVKVNYNQKHTGLTIPVTLDITRVEGGA